VSQIKKLISNIPFLLYIKKNEPFLVINEIVARKFLEIGDKNLIFAIKDLGRGVILSPVTQEEILETYPTFEEQFVISRV